MVTRIAGAVVLVPFPFSDLSQARLRPAVVLAHASRGEKKARMMVARCPRDSLDYRGTWGLPLVGPEARGGPGWDTTWGWGNVCNTIASFWHRTLAGEAGGSHPAGKVLALQSSPSLGRVLILRQVSALVSRTAHPA